MVLKNCYYCDPAHQTSGRVVLQDPDWTAFFDNHPVSIGCIKPVLRKHTNSPAYLTNEEMIALHRMAQKA
jgi:diadenosine tetraphosphate (Ap4A) HIT family hydrolase